MTTVKCLLVDDREENLLVLQALLRQDHVELLTARSGVEALDLLLAHDVALALIDVQMPEMDGFELAETMRGTERTRHVPIIFVTAGAHDQHRVFKGYDMGAVDFLYKPIEPAILRNKAAVFFQLARQKQQLEQELRDRTETLRLNEMFAAVLSHDLRSPLGVIVTSAELLPKLSTDPNIQQVASGLLTSGLRMNRMISDLLDMARARLAGGMPMHRQHADLGAIVAKGVAEQKATANGRAIEVASDGDATGTWDPDRLAQVVSNLVGNAIQHGTPGTAVHVIVDGTCPDTLTLTVRNAGAIDAATAERIFEPFWSGRRRERSQSSGGLGLGLYIAQEIVRAHGGQIAVHSEHDTTSFVVKIPRHL